MTEGTPTANAAPQNQPLRLGDLLTSAGLLKAEELRQAMLIAKSQGLPVGRVIIMSGFMSESNLQAAVQCQSLLKDGILTAEIAVSALRTLHRESISLDEALQKLSVNLNQSGNSTNKLGELLIEAGILTKAQLDDALAHGKSSGLPLGRVLVVTNIISEQLLASALNAQILIRDKRVEREQAISSLRAAKDRQVPLEQTLAEKGLNLNAETVRLGELLVMAKLLDEQKLMQIVEVGLVKEQPIGQVLVESGLVSESLLQLALSVQTYVASGKLRKSLSGQVLEMVAREGISVETAVERIQPDKQQISNNLPLYQFLQLAGVIGPKDIEDALKAGSRNAQLMGQMLLLTGAIDQNLLQIALKCSELMAQGILKAEQAVIALGICWKTKGSLEDAFRQLGWSPAIIAAAFPKDVSSSTVTSVGAGASITVAGAPTAFQPTNQGQTHQSPLAAALSKGRMGDSTASGLPSISQGDPKKRSERRADATAAALPALAMPGQPALNLLHELENTGDNQPTIRAELGHGDRAGETTGDNTAISGSSDSNRKKKLSELIPQIKNQG
ncbi:MAG: hypothetical protein K2Y32_10835 [Candidatus Obscuribacterales bacterium]|nr:hypothetical protein [Candidatus Obscuribacterales bacterium]